MAKGSGVQPSMGPLSKADEANSSSSDPAAAASLEDRRRPPRPALHSASLCEPPAAARRWPPQVRRRQSGTGQTSGRRARDGRARGQPHRPLRAARRHIQTLPLWICRSVGHGVRECSSERTGSLVLGPGRPPRSSAARGRQRSRRARRSPKPGPATRTDWARSAYANTGPCTPTDRLRRRSCGPTAQCCFPWIRCAAPRGLGVYKSTGAGCATPRRRSVPLDGCETGKWGRSAGVTGAGRCDGERWFGEGGR